jgi:hypothetical protein
MAGKVGHPRNVKDPKELWTAFVDYAEETKANPRFRVDYVGKDGERVNTPLERPLTTEGFFLYCYDKIGCVKQYYYNQDNLYNEYIEICSRIRESIRRDQIEGGMVGQYNASITQRLNGLVEKSAVEVKSEQPLFPDVRSNDSYK